LLTNGTLLHDQQVRNEIRKVDLALPSLDAVTADVFAKINRPAAGLGVHKHIQGLIDFSHEFNGRIWLEVFILPGINDHPDEIRAMRRVIMEISPDSVQLNTLDRPGTAAGLRAATGAELLRVKELLALDKVEIIAAAALRKNIPSYRGDAEAAILETIARRPCTLDDLAQMLGLHGSEINKYLDVLDAEDKIEAVQRERRFLSTGGKGLIAPAVT
jgi:wyosine [tRNA(Phe)-imidazoG37] synthetase (radical SAM superfamily)